MLATEPNLHGNAYDLGEIFTEETDDIVKHADDSQFSGMVFKTARTAFTRAYVGSLTEVRSLRKGGS